MSDRYWGEFLLGILARFQRPKNSSAHKKSLIDYYDDVFPGSIDRLGKAAKILNDREKIESALKPYALTPAPPQPQSMMNSMAEKAKEFNLDLPRMIKEGTGELKKFAERFTVPVGIVAGVILGAYVLMRIKPRRRRYVE